MTGLSRRTWTIQMFKEFNVSAIWVQKHIRKNKQDNRAPPIPVDTTVSKLS